MQISNFRAGVKSLLFRRSPHPSHLAFSVGCSWHLVFSFALDTRRRLVVSLLNPVGAGDSRRQTAEAVPCGGIQNGNSEGSAAVLGESHGEAGGPAGFRPSLALQISRRVRGEPALMFSGLCSGLQLPLWPVAASLWVRLKVSHLLFSYAHMCSLASSSGKSPTTWDVGLLVVPCLIQRQPEERVGTRKICQMLRLHHSSAHNLSLHRLF